MAITDITTVDFTFVIIDLIVVTALVLKYYRQGTSFRQCRAIEISQNNLDTWRYFLYGTIISVWLSSYLLFVLASVVRHILHLFFLIGLNYMLHISLPAYICKAKGYGGTCNCDFYEYNDFTPMVVLGLIGTAAFVFIDWDLSSGSLLFIGLLAASYTLNKVLPKRELVPLKYPEHLKITEIDQLQAYLMSNPHEKKLLTILDAKCDFCEIQVEEILRSSAQDGRQIRIFDLTETDKLDPIIPMTLNMNLDNKIPVPTTFIFDSGMAVEQKDGVLSKNEIEAILMQ